MADYEVKVHDLKQNLFSQALKGLSAPQVVDIGIGSGPNLQYLSQTQVQSLSMSLGLESAPDAESHWALSSMYHGFSKSVQHALTWLLCEELIGVSCAGCPGNRGGSKLRHAAVRAGQRGAVWSAAGAAHLRERHC